MDMAVKNFFTISTVEAKRMTSYPSGSPTSTAGNLTTRTSISSPRFRLLSMALAKEIALTGVKMMVALQPREANRLAMSIAGIMRPLAMYGKKKM